MSSTQGFATFVLVLLGMTESKETLIDSVILLLKSSTSVISLIFLKERPKPSD